MTLFCQSPSVLKLRQIWLSSLLNLFIPFDFLFTQPLPESNEQLKFANYFHMSLLLYSRKGGCHGTSSTLETRKAATWKPLFQSYYHYLSVPFLSKKHTSNHFLEGSFRGFRLICLGKNIKLHENTHIDSETDVGNVILIACWLFGSLPRKVKIVLMNGI